LAGKKLNFLKWAAQKKKLRTSDVAPCGLNPAWIIAVLITIHSGSSIAPNENLVLILFKVIDLEKIPEYANYHNNFG
jgi:hypothetical protein